MQFSGDTGLSQTNISDIEHGKAFHTLRRIGTGLDRAGIDPLQLFRLALANADLPEGDRDLASLIAAADPEADRSRRRSPCVGVLVVSPRRARSS